MSTRTGATGRAKAAPSEAAALEETVAAPAQATTVDPTFTEGLNTMTSNTQNIVAFGKANLEALVESNKIWAAGIKELSAQAAATAKASYDESLAAFKALGAVKTPAEAIELQTGFAKAAIAGAVAESKKLAEASRTLTEQALAPLTARVTAAVESFKKAA